MVRRLCSPAKLSGLMNSALVVQVSSIFQNFCKQELDLQAKKLFRNTTVYDSNIIPTPGLVDDFPMDLSGLPVLKSLPLLEIFLGVTAWDQEKFCLRCFIKSDIPWGSIESLNLAVKNFVSLAIFCFGTHMDALWSPLEKIITNNSVRNICSGDPMFLIYLINFTLYTLWYDLRGPLFVNNILFPLDNLNWVTWLQSITSNLRFDANNVFFFKNEILPSLPIILRPTVQTSNLLNTAIKRQNDSNAYDLNPSGLKRQQQLKNLCIKHVASLLKVPGIPVCSGTCKYRHYYPTKSDIVSLTNSLNLLHVSDNIKQKFIFAIKNLK